MKQDENEQNYKKGSTPVVGKKPNGKSRLDILGYENAQRPSRHQVGFADRVKRYHATAASRLHTGLRPPITPALIRPCKVS